MVTPAQIPPAQHQIPYFYFCEPRPRAMADEVPLIEVRTQTALQQTLLPFEPERFALLHLHRSLQIIYLIHRYDWNVAGIYSFLRARDQDMLSLCCYATRREHVERRTDDFFLVTHICMWPNSGFHSLPLADDRTAATNCDFPQCTS